MLTLDTQTAPFEALAAGTLYNVLVDYENAYPAIDGLWLNTNFCNRYYLITQSEIPTELQDFYCEVASEVETDKFTITPQGDQTFLISIK
jgi:hypothetical protein